MGTEHTGNYPAGVVEAGTVDEQADKFAIQVDWIAPDKSLRAHIEAAAGMEAIGSGTLLSNPRLHDAQFEVTGLDVALTAYMSIIKRLGSDQVAYGYVCLYEAGEDPLETTVGEHTIGNFPESVTEFLKGSPERFFKALQKAA